MRISARFYKCVKCSTLVEALNPQCCDEMHCCGNEMVLLRPETDESAPEAPRHLPVVKREGAIVTVCVGRVLHPMSREHRIVWIELRGGNFVRRAYLGAGEDPIVSFTVGENDSGFELYAYCTKHGLWKVNA